MAGSRALFYTLCAVFVLIVGDCVSTYLCLTTPPPEGLTIWEANPVSAWMFQRWGIASGLIIFLLVKTIGLVCIWKWAHMSQGRMWFYLIVMGGAVLLTAYVNYNNFYIYYLLVSYGPA